SARAWPSPTDHSSLDPVAIPRPLPSRDGLIPHAPTDPAGGPVTAPERTEVALTRPTSAQQGPLDEQLYDLVESRFRRLLRDHPPFATFAGIHTTDDKLGDGSRDAVLGEMAQERAHLTAVEAIDPAGLSDDARFERDLEIHNLKRSIFDAEVHRVW